MSIRILLFNIFCIFQIGIFAQTEPMPRFQLSESSGQYKVADSQLLTQDGWVHYFNKVNNHLILSIKMSPSLQGSSEGMVVSSGLLGTYGTDVVNLTKADYVPEGFQWLAINRYWRIIKAPAAKTSIRFYIYPKDLEEINQFLKLQKKRPISPALLSAFGFEGDNIHPFTENTIDKKVRFNLFGSDHFQGKPQIGGRFQDLYFVEIEVDNLNFNGSLGYLFANYDNTFSLSGQVKTPDGSPLPKVMIKDQNGKTHAVTDANGNYTIKRIRDDKSYTFTPYLDSYPAKGLSVLDIVFLRRALKKNKILNSPYQFIAGDANYSGYLTEADLDKMLHAILKQDTTFSGNGGWNFVVAGSRVPSQPLKSGWTKSYSYEANTEPPTTAIDFVGIKTGDVVKEADFPNKYPLDINPAFYVEDQVSCGIGDTLLVPIKVQEFRRILGFQFSLQWDNQVMDFIGVEPINLPDFNSSNFTTRLRNEGAIGVAWYSPSQRGTSIKDDEIIGILKFVINGNHNSKSYLEFKDYPTPIQILRDNYSEANTLLSRATINIEQQSSIEVADINILSGNCHNRYTANVEVKMKDPNKDYIFQWSNSLTGPIVRDIKPGTYSLRISEGTSCPLIIPDIKISKSEPLLITGRQIKHPSCSSKSNGSIKLSTIGGVPPIKYQWNTGESQPYIENLGQGQYNLTVTDDEGCSDQTSIELHAREEIQLGISLSDETDVGQSDGAIQITQINGVTPPVSYQWDNGINDAKNSNLTSGSYSLKILDADGCRHNVIFQIGISTVRNEELIVELSQSNFKPGTLGLVTILSPQDIAASFKIFDTNSRQHINQRLSLLRGTNTRYFEVPGQQGTYLLQVLPSGGGVQSLRFKVI